MYASKKKEDKEEEKEKRKEKNIFPMDMRHDRMTIRSDIDGVI